MDKKSLLNNLKSAKKANVIKAGAKNEGKSTRKSLTTKRATIIRPKMAAKMPGI